MTDPVQSLPKPEGYAIPKWEEVSTLLEHLKRERQPVIDRIWRVKRARRGQWDDVIRKIPKAYRQHLVDPDLPIVRDMIQRVVGLIQKQEPVVQVDPASIRSPEVSAAAKEEASLQALRVTIEDQQSRPIYAMGIDAQAAWGESWIGVWPDPTRWRPEYERGDDEEAEEYRERYKKLMASGGVPICFEDFDPQTVYPLRTGTRMPVVVIETEHSEYGIALGMGFKAKRDENGVTRNWEKSTFSQGFVLSEMRQEWPTDTTHDTSVPGGGNTRTASAVKRVIYLDEWVMITYLDGLEVERWEHGWGFVPMFDAAGEQTSDRDPGYESAGIADAGLSVARQLVMFAAIMASNGLQHGFPTPFVKNPEHGLVHPNTGMPLTRQVVLGEINLLGPQEEIEFPYLNAQMGPDFLKHLDWLMNQMESTTVSNFGKAIGSDIAGYAVAQIRAMQLSILSTIYSNAASQWRRINYALRHIVRSEFPGGVFLRGAIQEDEEGNQYRPILHYGPEHCTDNPINVAIPDGIPQDEMAKQKMAIELGQAGYWSPRRVMEETGVDDPERETDEINLHRLLNSPAADQQTWILAMAIAAQRYQATEEQKSSPLMQALAQAKAKLLGAGAPGQPVQPGSDPANANAGGQPIQQNPPPATPLEGGPTQGATPGEGTQLDLKSMAIPQMPGGVQQERVPA